MIEATARPLRGEPEAEPGGYIGGGRFGGAEAGSQVKLRPWVRAVRAGPKEARTHDRHDRPILTGANSSPQVQR